MSGFKKIINTLPAADKTTASEEDYRREQRKKENNASAARAQEKKKSKSSKKQTPSAPKYENMLPLTQRAAETAAMREQAFSRLTDADTSRTGLSRRYAEKAVEEMKRRGLYKLPDVSESVKRFDRFKTPTYERDKERLYRQAENNKSLKRGETKSIAARYGINTDTFNETDFKKWANEHNFTYYGGDVDEYAPKRSGTVLGFGGKKLTTPYEENAMPILKRIAELNTYKKQAEQQPIRTSLKTIAAAPSRGVAGFIAGVDDLGKVIARKPIDTDSEAHRVGNDINTAREIVSDKHASKWFGGAELPLVGNAGQFVYNALMSAGDSAANTALGAVLGLPGITTGLMSSAAMSDSIAENKRRGMDDEQAVVQGMMSGGIEMLTEKYSLDAIMKEPKTLFKGLLKSFAAEGSEEVASNWLNKTMDALFNGDDAQIRRAIKDYTLQGLGKKEAIKRALTESLTDDFSAGLAGGLSGMAMHGAYHGINTERIKSAGAEVRKGGHINTVIEQGLSFGENTDAYKNASKISQDIKAGKTPTDAEIGRLCAYVAAAQKNAAYGVSSSRADGEINTVYNIGRMNSVQNPSVNSENLDGKKEIPFSLRLKDREGAITNGTNTRVLGISSDTTIPQNSVDVNGNSVQNSNEFGAATTPAAERFKSTRPRYFEIIDGISKKLAVTTVIDDNIEGKDGFWNPRTRELHINTNAENPVNVILKHEITHVLEGNSAYDELIDFMKTSFKNEWAQSRQTIADTYERINARMGESERIDISDSMLDSETMAEFAQEFNTDDFIERTAVEKPGMITKVRDFIRNVIERIKGVFSQKELSPWEQAEKKWERAAHGAIKNGYETNDAQIRNAVNNKITADDVKNVQSIGRKSVNDFSDRDIIKTENFARKYFDEIGTKSPFFRSWFGDWRANDTTPVKVVTEKGNARGITKNLDTGWNINISGKVFNETKAHNQNYNVYARPYLDYINGIVENAVLLDSYTISGEKSKSANSAMMHSLYAIADMGSGPELIKLYVEELNDINKDGTIKRAYQLQNITKAPIANGGYIKIPPESKRFSDNSLASSDRRNTYTISQAGRDVNGENVKNQQPSDRVRGKSLAPSAKVADNNTISQTGRDVNGEDIKSQQQRVRSSKNIPSSITLTADRYTVSQLFDLVKNSDKNFNPRKSSVVVNEDGTPKVVYHGTDADFTVFEHSQTGKNFGDIAEGVFFFTNYKNAYPNSAGDYARNSASNNGGTAKVKEVYLDIKNPLRLDSIGYYSTNEYYDKNSEKIYNRFFDGDYDGIIIENSDKSADDAVLYIVDNSAQIKSATDNTGMFSKYNPDIRYKVADTPAEQAQNTKAAESVKKIEQEFAEKSREINNEKLSEKSLADVFFEMSPEERKKHFGNLREGYELDTDLPEKLAEMPPEWSDEMKMTALGWRKIYEQRKGQLDKEKWERMLNRVREREIERAAENKRFENTVDALKKKIIGNDISAEDEIGTIRKYQRTKDYKRAAASANAVLKKLQSSGNAAATPDVIDYLDAETKFEIFLNRADALVDNQLDELEKRKPSLAKEIRAEAADARKIVRKVWGDNAAAKSKGEVFEQIKKQMESEEIPDIKGKTLWKKGPKKKKSALDHVYDKYKIKHIDTVDMQRARETLDTIGKLDTKEDLIKIILKQSKERKTQVHGIKKALQGQEIVFLKDIAVQQLFNTITDAEGVSFGRKISTYQTMSHLLNPATMNRNITSNSAFSGTSTVASWVAAPVDKLMSIFTHKRTVGAEKFSLSNYKSGAKRATKQYIDIALAVDHSGKGKYDLNSAVRSFQSKTGGTLERAMGYGLQVTDEWQKGIVEDRVRKSLEKLKKSGFTEKEINEIVEYEAKYRTFQDTTGPSQFMTKLKEAFNVIGIKDFGLGDIIQKYTQVPGAIITRSAEFTPLGYVKALNGITKVALRKNEMTAAMQRNIAMSIGRATTGTGLIMLFSLLSKLGIFVGDDSGDDSKELQKLKKAEGLSGFQINLSALERLAKRQDPKLQKGDLLESIGFLEPLNVEMAIGYELSKRKDFGIKNWADICSAQVFEQIAEIPAMQSLRNFQNTIDYGGNCVDIAIGIFASGATGFIPSKIRKTGNYLDPVQRYPYKQETPLKKGIEQIKAAIPYVRKSVPATITPYGEEKQSAKGIFNNFFNPGYATIYQPGDISEELYRMANVSSDVLPHVPADKFTVDGREFRLYGHDYEEYSKTVGERTHTLLKAAIEHADYAALSDEDKAAVLASLANTAESESQTAYSNRNLKEVRDNTDASGAAIAVVGQKKFREMSDRLVLGENVSTILDGTAKCVNKKTDSMKKTSDSQKMRVYGYLEIKVSHGEITKEEARRQFNAYLAGNLEMPVFDTYTKEFKKFSEMTIDQKKSKITGMFNKYKSKEITKEEYIKWRNDFFDDKIEVEVNNYVFEDYSDCDDRMKKKLQNKLRKRAFEDAETEVTKQQQQ